MHEQPMHANAHDYPEADRMLNHDIVIDIERQLSSPFTLDACCNDNGNNAHCHNFCSPSNSFLDRDVSGQQVWMNPPFKHITAFIKHYLRCKSKAPTTTSACIVLPAYPGANSPNKQQPWTPYLKHMVLLRQYSAGAKLFSAPTADGSRRPMPGCPFPVNIWWDPPLPPPPDIPICAVGRTDETPADMLFQTVVNDTTAILTLVDTGATHGFAEVAMLTNAGATIHPTQAKRVQVAGKGYIDILGEATIKVRINAFVDQVKVYAIHEVLQDVPLILGRAWIKSRRAVLDYDKMRCIIKHQGRTSTIVPIVQSAGPHEQFDFLSPIRDGVNNELLTAKQANRAIRKGAQPMMVLVRHVPSGVTSAVPVSVSPAPNRGPDADITLSRTDTAHERVAMSENGLNHQIFTLGVARHSQAHKTTAVVPTITNQTNCPGHNQPTTPGNQTAVPSTAAQEDEFLIPDDKLKALLAKYKHVMPDESPSGLPPDRGTGDTIVLEEGHRPPFRRCHRMSPQEREVAEAYIKDLLARGLITPSTSPYGAPIMFIPKKDGKLRVVCDWRMLNKITIKNRYPLPRIDEMLDRLNGAKVFSLIDLDSAYFQIRLSENDSRLSAFTTPWGHFEWKVLGQGLTNSPATFQSVMNRTFAPYLHKFLCIYLDDVLIYSKDAKSHYSHLETVLQILEKEKFFTRTAKCRLNQPEVKFLGFIVDRNGVRADDAKVATVSSWPVPTDVSQLRSFLGLTNFFKRYVQGYSSLTAPLTDLTAKGVDFKSAWTPFHTSLFNQLKQALTSAPVLALPDFTKPFEVISDASLLGTGAVLMQEGRPIAFASKKFTSAERNYTTGEQELLGVVNALTEWRCYLEGSKCTLCTDHNPLTYLQSQTSLSRRQARWMEFLSRFDYEFKYIPGRTNVADPISRNPALVLCRLMTMRRGRSTKGSSTKGTIFQRLEAAYKKDPWFSNPVNTATLSYENGVWLNNARQILVPESPSLRHELIHELHSVPTCGHTGARRTYEHIARSFKWQGMRKDINDFVHKCHQCQINKASNQSPGGLLNPVEIPDRPWECISMDLITSLPTTKDGNDAIIVWVDKLTKMVHLTACRTDINAEQYADAMFNTVFKLHGLPKKIVSDRDARFTGKFMSELTKLLGTGQSFSTAFHPQTDGQTERMNRVLEDMLRHYVSPYHDDWDKLLPAAEFAINNAWQESVQNTPFFLNYGQHPFTPTSMTVSSKVPRAMRYAQSLHERIQHAKKSLEAAQQRQKAYADQHRRDVAYAVNDMVLLSTKNLKLKTSGCKKLMPKYIGPYKITQLIQTSATQSAAVKLDLPAGMRVHNVFHVSLIKPYRSDGTCQPPAPLFFEQDGSPIWEVACLLDKRQRKVSPRSTRTITEYLVQWHGFGPEHNSWEPHTNILDKTLISAYNAAHPDAPAPEVKPKQRANAQRVRTRR